MTIIKKENALGGRLLFNVLVKDVDNAKEVWEASQGYAVLSIVLRDYPCIDSACDMALAIKEISGHISIGLGGGDSSQWRRVVDVSLKVDPGHVNQVFPATGFTIGALSAKGLEGNIVNALVAPSGKAGYVVISTGPLSESAPEKAIVPCETAFQMIKEVGGTSVKVFPIGGDKRLNEIEVMSRVMKNVGIEIMEPTGGITVGNLEPLLRVCLEDGPELVIPHVHSSIMDPTSGYTDPSKVAELVQIGKRCLGIR
jgi:2-dehydro-3-deoxy-phosphogluconate aldolase